MPVADGGGQGRRPFEIVPPEQWPLRSAAEACAHCGKPFGIFRPPENCRACGRVFCASPCLDSKMVLPGDPGSAPVHVCDACAESIRRLQQDAEMAVHRCRILEELLNEQTKQSEKLINQSKELRQENESLIKEKGSLQENVKRLELQLEVAAAQNSLTAAPGNAENGDPGSAAAASPPPDNSREKLAEQEKALEKKKKQLDMREMTLQEALKKVSNDAAKLVTQRSALQEQEKALQATLSRQFAEAGERQRAQLDDAFLSERARLQKAFQEWIAEESKNSKRAAAKAASRRERPAPGVPQEAVDAMKAEWEQQHSATVEELNAQLARVREEAAQHETELSSLRAQSELLQHWEEDKLVLQGSIGALKRSLEEARQTSAALQSELVSVKMARAEAVEQVSEQKTEALKSAVDVAVAELRSQLEEARARADSLQQERDTLAADSESKIAQARAEVRKSLVLQHTAELRQARADFEASTKNLSATYEAKISDVERAHAAVAKELKTDRKISESTKGHRESKRIVALTAAHERKVAELNATIAELWDELARAEEKRSQEDVKTAADTQSAMVLVQEAKLSAMREAHAAELASLQARCDAVEAQLVSAAEAAAAGGSSAPTVAIDAGNGPEEDTSVQVIEMERDGSLERDTATEVSLTRSTAVVAEALLTAASEASDCLLAQHTELLSLTMTSVESVTTVMKRAEAAQLDTVQQTQERHAEATTAHAEAISKLQRQLKAAKRESQTSAQRAAELERESLQQKRAAVVQSSEVAQLKEKLRKAQRAAALAERAAPEASNSRRAGADSAQEAAEGTVAAAAAQALVSAAGEWHAAVARVELSHLEEVSEALSEALLQTSEATVAATANALERHRAVGRRQAAALEQTTSTIKTVQADLRLKAAELGEREAILARQEQRARAAETSLNARKRAVRRVCADLRTVVGKLKERERGLRDEALLVVEDSNSVLLSAENLEDGAELSALEENSPSPLDA